MLLAATIADGDRAVLDAVATLRTRPLTTLALLLSAWWVKGVLIGALAVGADVVRAPRRWPPSLLPVAAAVGIASLLGPPLKALADRARPPVADPAFHALTAVPGDGAMPSGHALTAFAVAGVVAALHPRLRVPALALAALVGLSRIYLGVHFPIDVVAGALAGLAVAALVVAAERLIRASLREPPAAPIARPQAPS